MCEQCKHKASKAAVENDTPIFRQLTLEYQNANRPLPWRIMWKPSGTISMLSGVSTGMHPTFQPKYPRRIYGQDKLF